MDATNQLKQFHMVTIDKKTVKFICIENPESLKRFVKTIYLMITKLSFNYSLSSKEKITVTFETLLHALMCDQIATGTLAPGKQHLQSRKEPWWYRYGCLKYSIP